LASLFKSTGIIAFSVLISRVFGFIREILFANFFGASGVTDAFFIAFRIPNLFRRLVAEGSLTVSFIPVYTDFLVKKGKEEALLLAQKTLSLLVLFVFIIILLGEFFTPQIINIFAYGFQHPETINLAINFTRIMFPYLFCASFVAFSMGVLNSHGYFFAPAFSTVLLNISIIFGITFFSLFFQQPIYGVTVAVLIGGLAQILLQIPYLIKSGFKLKISIDFQHSGIKKIFKLILPTIFGTAIYQINIIMGTLLASLLATGSISYLYYSDRLAEIVAGVFIISIGNVILPEMSKLNAAKDYKKFKQVYVSSLNFSLFLALPASLALIAIGLPIITVFFLRGSFTVEDAKLTYQALFYTSLGISSLALLRIITPTFFSLKNTKTPVITSTLAFFINISLGFFLMKTSLKHAGLALANTVAVTVQVFILFLYLQKKIGKINLKKITLSFSKYLVAAGIMSLSINHLSKLIDWFNCSLIIKIFFLISLILAGGAIYFIGCWILKVEEMKILLKKIKAFRDRK